MEVYKRHIELLGRKAKDKMTGFTGVIDSICFDAYGCIQASIKPPMNEKGELPSGYWVDVTRIELAETERVIPLPNFLNGYIAEGFKGPADKPTQKA